jgi:hypothetical protein
MKKIILLTVILFLQLSPVKAQWVTIPDPNFVAKLTQLFPNCMNGNQMDITCFGVVSATSLDLSYLNISNLAGIEHFVNLTTLNCQNNQLDSLPTLPTFLQELQCQSNQLINLPTLPTSLKELQCQSNQLTNLPALSNSLELLYCYGNQLTNLPVLPNALLDLKCGNTQLTNLPQLPNSLQILNTNGCSQLINLPSLPGSLQELFCAYDSLTYLPALPNSLKILRCPNNQITSLPALPDSLQILWCYNNQLTNLPQLPNTLIDLSCNSNQLTSLPVLPGMLQILYCGGNQLSNLPILPDSLDILTCDYNLLTSLPPLPDVMTRFLINNNNIYCLNTLPEVIVGSNPSYANITNNPFTCVPNQTNYSFGFPLCIDNDSINNPNNCISSVNISGYVFTDQNNNCLFNIADLHSENIPVKLLDNQNNLVATSYTIDGAYSFASLLPDTFQIKIEDSALPIAIDCGLSNSQNVALDSANQTISNINFPVVCDTTYDIEIHSVNNLGWVFPGQFHTLNTNITNNETWYNIDCGSSNNSGSVVMTVSGPVTYISSASSALNPTVSW